MTAKIEVRGIRELNKALKQVDKELPKELKVGFKNIAEMVVNRVKPKVPSITGAAQSSIKPRSSQKGAGIAFGGSKAEYYPWLDFGGSVGRKKSIKRPFVKDGRYVYPTIKEMGPEIEIEVDKIIKAVAEKADFETQGG